MKLQSQRELEILKEKWWAIDEGQPKCDNPPQYQSESISLANIGGVFIVIFIGIGTTCIMLIFEFFWYNCLQQRN